MDLNVSNLSVDRNGRVSFSGLGSNIDFQGVIDSIVAAKRIPIDRLETQVSTNESKIAALGDLRSLLTGLKDSLSTLHGAVSFQNANDAFEIKEAFASSSRTDGAVASNAANLIGVTVSNSAPVGGHTLELLQTAKAHKIASDGIPSTSAPLGFSDGDVFTFATTDADGLAVNVPINVDFNTNLLGLRDLINNANSGTSATGVSASIVSVSTTEHYLVMSNEQTGADIAVTETAGTPLQTLGIFDSGSGVKNELQASQKALMYADGILDQTNTIYETAYQTDSTATPANGGILEFFDGVGASIGTVSYDATDDLTLLAGKINGAPLGVTASVVSDGSGFRMEISGGTAFTMTEVGGGSALTDLGVDNKRRVIERESNTVDDLFAGVTVSLFQAEIGTTINLDIERNLNEIKTSVNTFVDSYNELRRFINDQRTLVEAVEDDEETVQSGLLFSSEALDRADSQLSSIIGAGVAGVSSNYSVLAQVGIDFIPLGSEADSLDANTLEVDETTLDNALLNNVEDIRRLFSFDFTPSDPRVTLLGFNGNTAYSAAGYTLNIQPPGGSNLLQESETIDDGSYWQPSINAAISGDVFGIAAPDGSITADAIVAGAIASSHLVANSGGPVTVNAGDTYTYSTYVKKGNPASDGVRLYLNSPSGQGSPSLAFDQAARADFDLDAGTVTVQGSGIDNASIEDVGDDWYRVSITATATASEPATVETYSLRGGAVSFTGDGLTPDTYVWGAQLEVASANTTPIDTYALNRVTAINANAVAGADGGMTASEFIADPDNNPHSVGNGTTLAVTSGETYTFKTLVKTAPGPGGDAVRLQMGTSFAANSYIDFDLAGAGSIQGTGAGLTAADGSIEDMGNGWYSVSVTGTASATGNGVFELAPKDGTALSFAGDGVTPNIYFENMRVVPETSPGTYVQTTTAAAPAFAGAANIDGDAGGTGDGSVTISAAGNSLTVNTGDAAGMQLFFDGLTGPTSIDLNFTVGVGAQMFFTIDDLLDEATGTVETEIDSLTDTNVISEDRITEMLARLDIQRRSLLERFIAMETALATNARILDSVQASADSLNSSG